MARSALNPRLPRARRLAEVERTTLDLLGPRDELGRADFVEQIVKQLGVWGTPASQRSEQSHRRPALGGDVHA